MITYIEEIVSICRLPFIYQAFQETEAKVGFVISKPPNIAS